ncbi:MULTISPECIES: NRDE family protein [Halolamina]|uniref:Transport and Golgi organisation 2 n=1 Tax=Halolamina pelagica TaxID=699431 RepID=A0A1I5RUV1_9EURY|nr:MULTISPECIES: NRDE family protein [Halolamina]NHX35356.1 NRDE family protein [Halolamina sp. R1-12]SFP62278.1 Transport and Golgi organisation 2 [Halolamina pelagica]
MCTLTLAWQTFEDAPVVVAANRDERRDRPSEPPARIEEDPTVIAPLDAKAGGTWQGYNESGLFVGVTNRWTDADLAGERSRGLLVRDALREPSAEEAVRMVEHAVEDHEYAGFNLVLADATAAFLLEWDGRLLVRRLDPGVHVVVNVGASDAPAIPASAAERGQEQAADAAAVRTELLPEPDESSDAWLDRAAAVLGDHEFGVCVHENGYGTVSASLIALGADEGADGGFAADSVRFDFADGPPCETAFEPVDAPLR